MANWKTCIRLIEIIPKIKLWFRCLSDVLEGKLGSPAVQSLPPLTKQDHVPRMKTTVIPLVSTNRLTKSEAHFILFLCIFTLWLRCLVSYFIITDLLSKLLPYAIAFGVKYFELFPWLVLFVIAVIEAIPIVIQFHWLEVHTIPQNTWGTNERPIHWHGTNNSASFWRALLLDGHEIPPVLKFH